MVFYLLVQCPFLLRHVESWAVSSVIERVIGSGRWGKVEEGEGRKPSWFMGKKHHALSAIKSSQTLRSVQEIASNRPDTSSDRQTDQKTIHSPNTGLSPRNRNIPKCLAATGKPVKVFPYPVWRTAKTCRPAALQPLQSLTVWVFKALNLVNRVFKSKTQRVVVLDDCTVQIKNKSDLEHAQLTRGSNSSPRNRILPDLVSSSPFPSPLSLFCSRTAKTRSGDKITNEENSKFARWLARWL